jgi:hypothetical protein
MKIYKTRWFNRWAHKQRLDDLILCKAVREIIAGLYDADLGLETVRRYLDKN